MQPVLFDTSIYITALRKGTAGASSLRRLAADAPVWLSAVVLEELYAGAGQRDIHFIERLQRDFEKMSRIVVPNLNDWVETGRLLASLASKYDYEHIGRSRLTDDTLIAVSAGRLGIRIVTANTRDFSRLAEFRDFQWQTASV